MKILIALLIITIISLGAATHSTGNYTIDNIAAIVGIISIASIFIIAIYSRIKFMNRYYPKIK